MKTILHLGAHRCASTSYQEYMRVRTAALIAEGIGFWGPRRTRDGLLHTLGEPPETPAEVGASNRAAGRLRVNVARARMSGMQTLIVSDENMLGNPRRCLRARRVYRDAGERMARVGAAFGRVDRVVMVIRPQDQWWESVLAFGVARGVAVPAPEVLEQIAADRRGWRDVVTDVACALPEAEITVMPFDLAAGAPELVLGAATGRIGPEAQPQIWLHRAPGRNALRALVAERGEEPRLPIPEGPGRWQPFGRDQVARLREAWADDMHWLTAGADGLARLIDTRDEVGQTGPDATTYDRMKEGQDAVPLPLWQAVRAQRGSRHERRQGNMG